MAHDEDQGANSEVRYSFSHDLGDTLNIFTIDSHTGWISTLVNLDKETKAEYKFYVTATDNGSPKHSARTTVIVRLKDYNDSPTLFGKRFYESSVNEDALPGTVLLTLDTTDADSDLTTPVDFYIISGDPSSQFQIRQTGEIYVAKGLDREKVPQYELQVLVTDGMFTDTTNVSVNILDANGEYFFRLLILLELNLNLFLSRQSTVLPSVSVQTSTFRGYFAWIFCSFGVGNRY